MNIKIVVNGKAESIAAPKSIEDLLNDRSLNPYHVVVEVNGTILKREQYSEYILKEGDTLEILRFVGGGCGAGNGQLIIGGKAIGSRLITGSGKYRDDRIIRDVLEAAGCDVITVALRRIDFDRPDESILNYIPRGKQLLPNTSGARTAQEAVRIARLAQSMGCGNWIKIEVINDSRYLLPDNSETVKATEILVKEGFVVLPYMYPDLSSARRMVDAGAAAVMPLGSLIGSARGLQTRDLLEIMIEEIDIPVIVDAGIGCPSHAAQAMEMGADAVLLNTAIAASDDPVSMARAFKLAIEAGRLAYLSGMAGESKIACASSPLTGFLDV